LVRMNSEATSTIRCRVFAVSAFDFFISVLLLVRSARDTARLGRGAVG
jgi:hypothetical protein